MKTYKKNFIGKGTQVGTMQIVKIIIPIAEAEKTMFEKNGVKYFGFEVAKMKEADKYGRTHTVYYQTVETNQEETKKDEAAKAQDAPKPKRTRKPKTA